ncbi:hypothetical protein [Caminibacter sp.]
MKSEKVKIEIDLLRDSLRNIFIVMFVVISSVIGLIYKMFLKFTYIDLFATIVEIMTFLWLGKIRLDKLKEINEKLKDL